jgi:zinc-binding alcohol dehydrogenase/oxidoreductase
MSSPKDWVCRARSERREIMKTMKALQLVKADGPGSVALADIDTPSPGRGEVRVALKAAALNHRELWITRGHYPGMRLPCTLGCDGSGVIDAVGEGVDPARCGAAVMLYPGLTWGADTRFPAADFGLLGMPGPGTLAQFICVPAESALDKPDYLSFEEAAAVPLAALTAWRGLVTKGALAIGEHLLVTGVGGGVATFALQIAAGLGANVFVTSGNEETLKRAVQLGARAGFNYKDETWGKALRKVATGIDVVFDGAPASAFASYSRALNRGSRVVIYGSTGGAQFPCNAPELFLKNITLIGTNVGMPDELSRVVDFLRQHQLRPVIDRTFELTQAAQALAHLEGAHSLGKVVVTI